jgi:tetratricopeptide (TPR) repeat protein
MVFGLCLSSAGQHERALGELQAALNLNPSFALGHIVFGWALLRAGHFDEALVETGWALRMSPVDSFAGFYTTVYGLALLSARQFECLPHHHEAGEVGKPLRKPDLPLDKGVDAQLNPALDHPVERRREVAPAAPYFGLGVGIGLYRDC